jgi:CheY-like chemotaxis protein/HPt (histidine-containing phosphotransfer) domain-containing protein
LELRSSPFHLHELLEHIHSTFSIPTPGKEIAVSLQIGSDVPAWVSGDAVRLRQVLMNLMGNAIKFTERGRITLSVMRQVLVAQTSESNSTAADYATEIHDGATLRFAIRDTGIGIPEEKQTAIFAPFVQADGSITRRYGGTGLGLAISSQLVRLMGGSIAVTSHVGSGSEFRFTINLPTAQAPSSDSTTDRVRPMEDGRFRSLRILVAEDHPMNQAFAVQALQAAGHTVSLVSNGQEAVESVRQTAFDLVLMDVQMPVLDGLQATEVIRKCELGSGNRLPIVAMTAHALSGDRERCLAAGMDGYIGKPILVDDLHRAIASILDKPKVLGGAVSESALARRSGDSFDRTKFLQRTGKDPEFVRRIVAMFVEDVPNRARKVQEALGAHDAQRLLESAHSLKGVLKNFYAQSAVSSIESLEQCGKSGDFTGAETIWARLQSELDQLQDDLLQVCVPVA